jgi:maleate isomerase
MAPALVTAFSQTLEEGGFTGRAVKGLRCGSPVQIVHMPEVAIRDAIVEVGRADAVVGTNLPMSRVAVTAEFRLGNLVVALNTAT